MVHLEEDFWQVYRDRGLTVLGVDLLEEPSQVASWIELKGLTYPIVIDPDAQVYLRFSNGPFPHNVLIGRDGTLRYSQYGFDPEGLLDLTLELLDEDLAPVQESSWSSVKLLF